MIAYIIKSSISLAVLFLCYHYFFRKDKWFLFNRFYLLSAIVISLIAPLLTFPVFYPKTLFVDNNLSIVGEGLVLLQNSNTYAQTGSDGLTPVTTSIDFIFYLIYFAGLIIMGYRYLRNIIIIQKLITQGKRHDHKGAQLILIKKHTSPFSFGKYIFANNEDYNNGTIDQDILDHENIHVRHYHTLDILFIEFLLILYWFNPLLWIYRYALRANHEYCADDYAVSGKTGIEAYCYKLIDFTHHYQNTSFGSSFNYSLTKNRIIMMNRTKTSGFTFCNKLAITVATVLVTVILVSFKSIHSGNSPSINVAGLQNTPVGWHLAGSKPSSYEIGTTNITGNTVAYLKSKEKQIGGFGTIMQSASSEEFKGKRVKLSAKIRTEGVEHWAGLWFRVDGASNQLAFDNMRDRPITGTTDWQVYEVVLNVSHASQALAYGVLLSNTGSVWIDDVNLEIVNINVPVTNLMKQTNKPTNLDFEN